MHTSYVNTFPTSLFDFLAYQHPRFHGILVINYRLATIRHGRHVLCSCLRQHASSFFISCLEHPLHCLHWTRCSAQPHVWRWSRSPTRCLDLQAWRCQGRLQDWQLDQCGIHVRDSGYLCRVEVVVWSDEQEHIREEEICTVEGGSRRAWYSCLVTSWSGWTCWKQ